MTSRATGTGMLVKRALTSKDTKFLLELGLKNCVFSFQQKFYQQLQAAVMGSPISSAIANIYMEYFEEVALGSECPIATLGGKDV